MEGKYFENHLLDNPAFNALSVEDKLKFSFNLEFTMQLLSRRKEFGWTQDELAEKSGVNRVTISKIERFQSMASIEVILKLAHALGMRLSFSCDPIQKQM